MRTLTIGRYQPFHLGHRSCIYEAGKYCDEIVIGVGSSQESYTKENPFTAEERRTFIEVSLDNHTNSNYKIVFIPDIHNNSLWVRHIENILEENSISRIDVVYSNNPLVKMLFGSVGYGVHGSGIMKIDSEEISATKIRDKIAEGDDSWEKFVQKEVREKIIEFNGLERIRYLYQAELM